MGLAASQCRLLNLTARLSDLELRAQTISNSKIRLSMESADAAEEYADALDHEKLTFKTIDENGDIFYKDLVASMLMTYDKNSLDVQRLLKDSYGRLLVSEDTAQAFKNSNGSLPVFLNEIIPNYKSAKPADSSSTTKLADLMEQVQNNIAYTGTSSSSASNGLVTTDTSVSQQLGDIKDLLKNYSDDIGEQINSTTDAGLKANLEAEKAQIDAVINGLTVAIGWTNDTVINVDQDLLKFLFTGVPGTAGGEGKMQYHLNAQSRDLSGITPDNNISTLLSSMQSGGNDPAAVAYYTNIFNAIQSGGYVTATDDQLNSEDWLYNQLNNGNLDLYKFVGEENDEDDVKDGFEIVSWRSGDSSIITKTDKDAITRAEAKYEATMADIEVKDKQFDLQLKNIDTEHNATQTEIESVTKVINGNIERNFKMFQA